jgi:hypothetical protein
MSVIEPKLDGLILAMSEDIQEKEGVECNIEL